MSGARSHLNVDIDILRLQFQLNLILVGPTQQPVPKDMYPRQATHCLAALKAHIILNRGGKNCNVRAVQDTFLIIGTFSCTDRDANVILGQCEEYLPPGEK